MIVLHGALLKFVFSFSWQFELLVLFMLVITPSFPSSISCITWIALSPQRKRYQSSHCYTPQAFPLFKTYPLSLVFKRSCNHSPFFYESDASHISLHFMFPCLLWLPLYLKVFFFLFYFLPFYFVHTHACVCVCVSLYSCATLLMVSGLLSLHAWLQGDYSIYGCQLEVKCNLEWFQLSFKLVKNNMDIKCVTHWEEIKEGSLGIWKPLMQVGKLSHWKRLSSVTVDNGRKWALTCVLKSLSNFGPQSFGIWWYGKQLQKLSDSRAYCNRHFPTYTL